MRLCRVDHRGVKHLPGSVNDCKLAACSVTGVKSENRLALERRSHKQVLEVFGEQLYRALGGNVEYVRAYLPCDRRSDKPFVPVDDGTCHIPECRAFRFGYHLRKQVVEDYV